jgi:hypothetical protein
MPQRQIFLTMFAQNIQLLRVIKYIIQSYIVKVQLRYQSGKANHAKEKQLLSKGCI